MKRSITTMAVMFSLIGAGHAFAQSEPAGPGTLEIMIAPGGETFFTQRNTGPSFGNYDLGASLTYNVNSIVGVEAEFNGALGISQSLQFGALNGSVKTPNLVGYSGNVVVSARRRASFIPYATGGIGGLSLLQTTGLDINATETFLTGNVGGGVKWYGGKRWGLRADYRFVTVQSQNDAPAFFGQTTRYGHRVYGGVVLNALK